MKSDEERLNTYDNIRTSRRPVLVEMSQKMRLRVLKLEGKVKRRKIKGTD